MVKRKATIDEIIAAIEGARDKVMADEVKSLTKLGIPKSMAYQMVVNRYRPKDAVHEETESDPFDTSGGWDDLG